MKHFAMVAFVVGMMGFGVRSDAGTAAAGGNMKEENCGAMMKSMVPLPTKFAELMTAVADGLDAHAAWMGMSKDANGKAEADTLKKISKDHRALAAAAKQAAADMDAAGKLAPTMHDMSKMDGKKMGDMMMKQAALEKEMAALMVKHAEDTEKMVANMPKAK